MRLGGVSEVATELGISPQRMRVLRASDQSTFPGPVAELSVGPVWDLDEIASWNAVRPGPGRPPSNALGGRFTLEADPIGWGGFADVYRATDRLQPGSVVAIKVLRAPEQDDHVGRFARELSILEGLKHDNVISMIDSGVDRHDRPWYAMPLAKGSLDDSLAEVSEDDDTIVEIILQVCEGLAYLHGINEEDDGPIFHRDLCPSNVLRTTESTWAIADFGLAREAQRRTLAIARSSVILGHIQYLAPEQLSGLKFAAVPADIYSIGRTLQALVLGRAPNMVEKFEAKSQFRTIINRATKDRAEDRYQSVEEFMGDVLALRKAPALWDGPPSGRLAKLVLKIKDAEPNSSATISEFRDLVVGGELEAASNREIAGACTHLAQLDLLQLSEPLDDFRVFVAAWAHSTRGLQLPFEMCDEVALFGQDLVSMSERDPEILHLVLTALVPLGVSHNRWHVRDVVVDLLQGATERDDATACANALRACDASDVGWTIGRFARQSMHPIIRDALEALAQAEG